MKRFDAPPSRTASHGVPKLVSARLSGRAAKYGGILACACFLLALAPGSGAQEPGAGEARAGWYVAAAFGGSRSDGLKQEGRNRENRCYPRMGCFGQESATAIPGYRWGYDIDLGGSAIIELSAGRRLNRARVELSAGRHRSGADQIFTGLSFRDGSQVPPQALGSTIDSSSETTIDQIKTRYLTLDAYYDFPNAWGALSPYLGAGLGRASMEVAGLRYSERYFDPAGDDYDPPLSFYTSVQNADIKGSVSIWRLHAGADYDLGANTLLGLKLSYSATGSYERAVPYETHPEHSIDPGFTNTTRFHGQRNWSVSLSMKRLLMN
ncbi:MAG: outer membrane beta-barrel protein [Gammaproteobacteria bacterium]|nr:outer membrane beta-barrel protein [Gammaproteobacteria bacterium]